MMSQIRPHRVRARLAAAQAYQSQHLLVRLFRLAGHLLLGLAQARRKVPASIATTSRLVQYLDLCNKGLSAATDSSATQ